MTTHAFLPLPAPVARAATLAGAAAALAGTFLPWTWTSEFPGDLTVTGYPGGLQVLTLTAAVLTLLFALTGYGIPGLRTLAPGGTNSPVRLLALGTLGTTGYTMGAISYQLGGVVNLEPGAWVSGIGALVAVIASLGLPHDVPPATEGPAPSTWQRFRHSFTAPAHPVPRPSRPGPRSSSSPSPSASRCTSSPTASASPPRTPSSSSASSSPRPSASPRSPAPDSSPGSPPSPPSTATSPSRRPSSRRSASPSPRTPRNTPSSARTSSSSRPSPWASTSSSASPASSTSATSPSSASAPTPPHSSPEHRSPRSA